jgi:choline dehydrogenase-like flavoprotein
VLAARLSEDPATRVCLIEAGGRGDSWLVRTPAGALTMVPGWGKINNWAFHTVPQAGMNGRRGYQPRGRCLGGSSAINAMLYVRGQRQDYDHWADLGNEGWDWDSVLPYFKRAESNVWGEDEHHGAQGPLQVSDQRNPRPVTRAFLAAAHNQQIPQRRDFNTGDNEGAGLYQVTQFHDAERQGERCSSAAGYLHPVMNTRPNLTVLTRARARRIVMQGTRATGVEIRQGRRLFRLSARRDVIVSAGAFGSPQLLMLSGIGPGSALSALGIKVVHDLPGVGENLQDHLDVTLGFTSRDTNTYGLSAKGLGHLWGQLRRWRRDGGGMIASPFAEGAAFVKSDPGVARADLQLHFVIARVEKHARKIRPGHGFSCHLCVLRPKSRGRVFLTSADPMADPGIDPAFLSSPEDLELMVKGARLTRRILMDPALAPYRDQELFGVHDQMSDADWQTHIRTHADTIYHPVGTCKMGQDDMAVVDAGLKVHGVDGLRVVDASIMPTLVSGNTNAPTIMIAEKAAQIIRDSA